ncbi:MAG: ribonuclease H-like domain-containing protein [Candidatus Eisenbacteria bacterium]|nr:ribonuclease H-like domain-containing protein [Candidatus Eisenbacteria bacterium]
MSDAFRERLSGIGAARTRGGRPGTAAPARSLDELRGVVRTEGVLVVERAASDLWRGSERRVLEELREARAAAHGPNGIDSTVLALLERPEDALFLDTETTGLAGSMVFLLGAMRVRGDDLVLTQVLARDYREEPALLEAWREMAQRARLLVSFNGKAFDVPVLRDRLGLHRIASPQEPAHVDLLHHARRRWRTVLPDCRLQTLEWQLCGRRRTGDIPGEEIPAAYHHFVRTGDPRDMLTVLHHNALDLLTLADIALALATDDGARGGEDR